METDNEITQKGVFAFLKYSFVIVCDFVATCVLLDYVYILPHVGRNVNGFLKVFSKYFSAPEDHAGAERLRLPPCPARGAEQSDAGGGEN